MKSKRLLLSFIVTCVLVMSMATPMFAATTADINVSATPSFVSISCNKATYDFGVIAASSTTNTSGEGGWGGITNLSTVQTDQTISVTTATWGSAGVEWTHSDTATIGEDTAGLKAWDGSAWVIVKNADPNFIRENLAALTDYTFGLSLLAPSSFTDGVAKSIIVRITAAAG